MLLRNWVVINLNYAGHICDFDVWYSSSRKVCTGILIFIVREFCRIGANPRAEARGY